MPYGDCMDRTYPATFKNRDCPKLKQAMAEVCQKWIVSNLRIYDGNYVPNTPKWPECAYGHRYELKELRK